MLTISPASSDQPVRVAHTADGHRIDFATVYDGDHPRLVISTLVGCPVRCVFCDAGGQYEGRLTAVEMLAQLDALVAQLADDRPFTIDLSRMGEPSFNAAVLDVLRVARRRYGPRTRARLCTVGPASRMQFFEALAAVARAEFRDGALSLRLSLHATDEQARRKLVPVRCLPFSEISALLRLTVDQKIELYFAGVEGAPMDPAAVLDAFPPDRFKVTLAELRPTRAAVQSALVPLDETQLRALHERWRSFGYETGVDRGDDLQHETGQSCGMTRAGERNAVARPRRLLDR